MSQNFRDGPPGTIVRDAASLQDGVSRELFEYWHARCRGGQPPSRSDIDPMDMRAILPHIGLIDVEWQGEDARFRYRLIGTYMSEMFGEDFTGAYLDDQKFGGYAAFLHDLYLDAARSARPIFSESRFGYRSPRQRHDRSHLWIKRLLLPLAEDGQVTMLLFTNHFESAPGERLSFPYLQQDIEEISEASRAYVAVS